MTQRDPSGKSRGDSTGDGRLPDVGVVVIGRNEGARLERCLRSVVDVCGQIVYVDSGSTDGSVAFSRSIGVHVVELDMSTPFTMARGRNAGMAWLAQESPDTRYVQFVDGDCEIVPGYIEKARDALEQDTGIAAVCGWRRERHPEASIYNRLADMEWAALAGEVPYCGGDVMMRLRELDAVGGFDATMIAGEEPELCVRFRKQGRRILRIPEEMTLHDAAIFRFSQWWRRATRGGHAYAEGAHMHGGPPLHHNRRQVRGSLLWGLGGPVAIVGTVVAGLTLSPWFFVGTLLIVLAYGLLFVKIYRARARTDSRRDAALYALFCVLGKFPQVLGIATFWRNRLLKRRSTLIEYKSS